MLMTQLELNSHSIEHTKQLNNNRYCWLLSSPPKHKSSSYRPIN